MALRAAGFKRNIFITAVAVRYAVLGLQRCLAFRAGNRHILSVGFYRGITAPVG
jgi:hypothetical protein